ncbi:predicted protein [Naegleria gruberi]|uniref:Predicted protein n=1 Tax=Naegleria gruberi TaxID=5762 RepID=D2VKI2_NAEGR|nr:uncharacterized protein NAEGRDRAFT_69402 [Naegleria gruberi]EFC42695.1 predicted protein [Naegleria gruberi]|eukprot:XP_002675439.1 predicted protein [Naegleria gruberi strain NEG-M]
MQLLKKHYQFIRNSEEDVDVEPNEYGENLAKEYERKLFRDYAIADLSKYKEGKIGLRWRTESEVLRSKGDLICAALNCEEKEELQSSLLNFSYKENGEVKQCLSRIIHDGRFAEFIIGEFETHNEWKLCVEKESMKSFYKDRGSGMHAVKVEGTIHASMFQVLSIFYEVDLYKSWVPSMRDSLVIHKFGKYRFLSYFSFNLPWPFSPRDLISYAFAIDRLESDGSIMVSVQGITPATHPEYKDKIGSYVSQDNVCAECEYASFLVKYVSPEETFVQIVGSVDPKLSYVPYWFINMVTDQISYLSMSKLRQVAKTVPHTEYQTRIDSNDEIYGDIKRRLEIFLSKK